MNTPAEIRAARAISVTDCEDLERLSHELIAAARKYREHVKRHHPQILGGVIFVTSDSGEMVVYSEGADRHNSELAAAIERIRDRDGY